jgi:hypothetical protein
LLRLQAGGEIEVGYRRIVIQRGAARSST